MAPLYAQSLLPRDHPLYTHAVFPRSQQQHSENATLALSGLVIALAVVSTGLRFYTRMFTRSGLKADDWTMFAAVLFTLATAAVTLAGSYSTCLSVQVRACADIRQPTALTPMACGCPKTPILPTSTPSKMCYI